MRDQELIKKRNKRILERYKELQSNHRHTRKRLGILREEFWLDERTLEGIIFNKENRITHQVKLFEDE